MRTIEQSTFGVTSIYENDEIRVIPLHSFDPLDTDERVIFPHGSRLPLGTIQKAETLEAAAARVAKSSLDLDQMVAVARLKPVTQDEKLIHGFVVESCLGSKVNLRKNFAARAFQLDELLKRSEGSPDVFDPIDLNFLRKYKDRTFSA